MARTEFFQRLEDWRNSRRDVDVQRRRSGIDDQTLLLTALRVAAQTGRPDLRPEYERLRKQIADVFAKTVGEAVATKQGDIL